MCQLMFCRTLESLDIIFHEICIIMLSKSKKNTDDSIALLGGEKVRIKTEVEKLQESINIMEEAYYEKQMESQFEETYGSNKSIYAKSKFYERYFIIFNAVKKNLILKECTINEVSNPYYAPKFGEYILLIYMPYVPLWSGLMLDLVDDGISHTTNAYVETHNKYVKEKLLENDSTNSIADVSRIMIERNISLIIEAGLKDLKLKSTLKSIQKRKYKEKAGNPVLEEGWKKSKQKYYNRQKTRSELTFTRGIAKKFILTIKKRKKIC